MVTNNTDGSAISQTVPNPSTILPLSNNQCINAWIAFTVLRVWKKTCSNWGYTPFNKHSWLENRPWFKMIRPLQNEFISSHFGFLKSPSSNQKSLFPNREFHKKILTPTHLGNATLAIQWKPRSIVTHRVRFAIVIGAEDFAQILPKKFPRRMLRMLVVDRWLHFRKSLVKHGFAFWKSSVVWYSMNCWALLELVWLSVGYFYPLLTNQHFEKRIIIHQPKGSLFI